VKKYMVRCDIEGVTGVVSYDQAEPGNSEYAFGQAMSMEDLLALLEGLRAGGAEQVVIYDEHYYGRNIDMGRLPDFACAICGKPPYRKTWSGGVDATFEGMILLGFHAMAGTADALLPHTYELDIGKLTLNGKTVGEIGMEAAVAADHEVPVLMVTGDSAGVSEARTLLPGVIGVSTKEALSESGALCYPPSVTRRTIREAAEKAVKNPPDVKPFFVGTPVTLEVTLNEGAFRDTVGKLFSDSMKNESIMCIEGRDATDVWAAYLQMKLRAQAKMV